MCTASMLSLSALAAALIGKLDCESSLRSCATRLVEASDAVAVSTSPAVGITLGKRRHRQNDRRPSFRRNLPCSNKLIDALGSPCGISLRRFLHEISCRRCTSGRQRVLSPLQQRLAWVEDSRGPDALAIARVTITWWPLPTIKGSPPPTAATISRLSR